ncbi:hypothetical protein TRM7557_02369 [Tritonibacter multivorans]|uniref:Secreted protein n=1 Tax=Tritonibacter multivorans TaxID=928856 RepID=A0A0P1GD29_9RHOB|nr:hypothetical protein [Tritonibacter multivorans]MDA7419951.1 hypothetical protein [Tritonibacter multivorans]CUH79386.1 hypothetical protein TRM7557_02369 [Tritonibacter multivorans]SFC10585.1 hypothetical protein SAMN04488049_101349 [Tritonibacter multivorans]
MKQILSLCGLLMALGLAAAPVHAADCYADYKAKQDQPLRLHYGVMELSQGCNAQSARQEVAARLKRNGWTLLQVQSVFDAQGLQQRKTNAGKYYLRF